MCCLSQCIMCDAVNSANAAAPFYNAGHLKTDLDALESPVFKCFLENSIPSSGHCHF